MPCPNNEGELLRLFQTVEKPFPLISRLRRQRMPLRGHRPRGKPLSRRFLFQN